MDDRETERHFEEIKGYLYTVVDQIESIREHLRIEDKEKEKEDDEEEREEIIENEEELKERKKIMVPEEWE